MKRIALLLVLLTAGGCTLAPQIKTTSKTAVVDPAIAGGVTFNKKYARGMADCGTLYSQIEGGYRSGKMSRAEAFELMGKVDRARAELDEARVLQVTNSQTASGKLSLALASIREIRETVTHYTLRIAI
ncbi:MAG: hypothetical protein WCI81_04045 [Chlorobiaceae bacterium]